MDHISKIAKLFALHFSGLANEAEENELQEHLAANPEEKYLFRRLSEDCSFRERYLQQNSWDIEAAISDFDRLTGGKRKDFPWKSILPYAAVLVIGLLIGGLWVAGIWSEQPVQPKTETAKTEIIPGKTKAILKLANGQLIGLSDTLSDLLSPDSLNMKIQKGELVYTATTTNKKEYNELILPRGSEFRLVLSDGSVVRLNSGSTLRYPVNFAAGNREVELAGEAYFDVATDSLHPFCVKTDGIIVKAYGTAFNINTHTTGHIYTALVRGRVGVQVESTGREYEMNPSQLADFSNDTHKVKISDTDLTPHIAWTEGRFVFVNETLEQMLNTLGLWYDFNVVFEQEEIRYLHFSGSMKRYEQISRIVDAISYTVGVKIRQEGKTLIVEKK